MLNKWIFNTLFITDYPNTLPPYLYARLNKIVLNNGYFYSFKTLFGVIIKE